VFVPGSFFTTTPNNVKVNKPLPVVIYLHGCTGINPDHQVAWLYSSLAGQHGATRSHTKLRSKENERRRLPPSPRNAHGRDPLCA
jgi:hypothetical protein